MVSLGEKNYYYLAILLLVLLFDQQVVAPPPPPANTPTHFLMVLQWSKAFCKNKPAECPRGYEKTLLDQFYIHGMWPKPTSGRLISEEYSFQVLVDLAPNDKKRLMTYWRSGMAAGKMNEGAILSLSSSHWAHEWKEHGQFQTLGQKEYFIFALDKYDSLSQIHTDVVKKFHTQTKVEVRSSDIVQYIQVKHRVTVDISCLPYDTAGKTMLYEMYVFQFNYEWTAPEFDRSQRSWDSMPSQRQGSVHLDGAKNCMLSILQRTRRRPVIK